MTRLAVTTSESVWLVVTDIDGVSGTVVGRASFGNFGAQHEFEGRIITGPDGLNLRPGTRLVFRCVCTTSPHNGYDGTLITSGPIVRVVNAEDLPEREVPEGFIDVTPSWTAVVGLAGASAGLMEEALQAGRLADYLSVLHQAGRVTDADLDFARDRLATR